MLFYLFNRVDFGNTYQPDAFCRVVGNYLLEDSDV